MSLTLICFDAANKIKVLFNHMVWTCTEIKTFWENVMQPLGKVIGYTVHCDPAMCPLNYTVKGICSKQYTRLIATNVRDADQLKEGVRLQTFGDDLNGGSSVSTF